MNNATHGASFPLLNDYQRDFPLVPEPFARIGAAQGLAETEVLAQYRRLQAEGLVSRIGPVFAPRRIGVSTLAALAAPPERLEWASVDPDASVILDARTLNNARRVQPDRRLATWWGARWLAGLQQLVSFFGM